MHKKNSDRYDDENYEDEDRGGNSRFKDEDLECKDCGEPFVFTVGEQEFYETKGFENKPVRCKNCKDAKKSRMEGGSRGGDRGGGRDRGGYGDDRRGGGGGVCYAFQKGDCSRGSACRFSHEGGGGGGGGYGGGRDRGGRDDRGSRDDRGGSRGGGYGGGGDRRGGGGYGGREERSGGGGVCYAFQKGECTRGSGCRFSHN